MQARRISLFIARVVADYATIGIAYAVAAFGISAYYKIALDVPAYLLFLSLLAVWTVFAGGSTLYDEFRSRDFTFELIAVSKAVLVQLVAAVVILFFLKGSEIPRSFVVAYSVLLFLGLTVEKYLFRQGLALLRKRGRNLRNLLIVGAGASGLKFYESVRKNPQFGYNPVGFVDDVKNPALNGQYLGTIGDLDRVIEEKRVGDVIIALSGDASERVWDVIRACERHTTRIKIVPDYTNRFSGRYSASMFGHFPVISVGEERLNEFNFRFTKRFFDIVFTCFLFATLFWWLWPIIALVIRLSSRGPVFYKQERWGKDNKRFRTYKFRSMVETSCELGADGRFRQAIRDDPRVTRIGRLLRMTSMDELPQFWNVLKGEMSIVGPRPHPTPLNNESKNSVPKYMQRHLVKPGVTGWAQVNGYRGETSDPNSMKKRVEHDMWYIENWSFGLDLVIILLTIWKIVRGDPDAY